MLQNVVMTCLISMLHYLITPRNSRFSFQFVMTLNRFPHEPVFSSYSSSSLRSSSSSPYEEDTEKSYKSLESSINACKSYSEISTAIAAYLIKSHYQQEIGLKLSLAVAGGGSSSISTLSSISGSSNILLEGNLLYHRSSFANFVSSSLRNLSHLPDIVLQEGDSHNKFQFASSQASLLLAYSALHESLSFISSSSSSSSSQSLLQQLQHDCLGAACSSTLVRARRSKDEQVGETTRFKSHAHISTWGADGNIFQYDILMSNNEENHPLESTTTTSTRRNRLEEDQAVGALVLWAILRHKMWKMHNSQLDHQSIVKEDEVLKRILDRPGDTVAVRQYEQYNPSTVLESTIPIQTHVGKWQGMVEYAIHRILRREMDTSIVIPNREKSSTNGMKSMESQQNSNHFSIMGHTILPRNIIIFPGSFNPLHRGHVALAHAAMDVLKNKLDPRESRMVHSSSTLQDKDAFLDQVWNATIEHHHRHEKFSILFEISLFNPDKPPIESKEVIKRLETFLTYLRQEDSSSEPSSLLSSLDWGVLLSSSPLFSEKVTILSKYLTDKSPSSLGKIPIRLLFVIGADTMVRIINPKYYHNSVENMIHAVRRMGDAGAHFIVGARMDQTTGVVEKDGNRRHVTGEEELNSLPEDVRSLFILLPTFRVDLSSSEIRARKQ